MAAKPVIGINMDFRSSCKEHASLSFIAAGYYENIIQSGGIPLVLPPLEDENMVLTIEFKQIEISLDGNLHDYGLDIILKYPLGLSPTQSASIDETISSYECCGNGFKDQDFQSGGMISPVPLPAAAWLFGSGLLGLVGMARRKKA
mgnify:CR=1 FL=1